MLLTPLIAGACTVHLGARERLADQDPARHEGECYLFIMFFLNLFLFEMCRIVDSKLLDRCFTEVIFILLINWEY